MKRLLLISIALLFVFGCGSYHGIMDIDTSKAEPACVRECATTYSNCFKTGIGYSNIMKACREAYAVCVSTCSSK